MSGSFLLDTSVIIAFFSGEPPVVNRFNAADEILLSSIVVGELCFGAQRLAEISKKSFPILGAKRLFLRGRLLS